MKCQIPRYRSRVPKAGAALKSLSTSALWRLLVLVPRKAQGAKDLRYLQAMTPGKSKTNQKYGEREKKKQEQVNSRPQYRRGDQKKKTTYGGQGFERGSKCLTHHSGLLLHNMVTPWGNNIVRPYVQRGGAERKDSPRSLPWRNGCTEYSNMAYCMLC